MSTGDQTAYLRSKMATRRNRLDYGGPGGQWSSPPLFMKDGFNRWAESCEPARGGGMDKTPSMPETKEDRRGGDSLVEKAKNLYDKVKDSAPIIHKIIDNPTVRTIASSRMPGNKDASKGPITSSAREILDKISKFMDLVGLKGEGNPDVMRRVGASKTFKEWCKEEEKEHAGRESSSESESDEEKGGRRRRRGRIGMGHESESDEEKHGRGGETVADFVTKMEQKAVKAGGRRRRRGGDKVSDDLALAKAREKKGMGDDAKAEMLATQRKMAEKQGLDEEGKKKMTMLDEEEHEYIKSKSGGRIGMAMAKKCKGKFHDLCDADKLKFVKALKLVKRGGTLMEMGQKVVEMAVKAVEWFLANKDTVKRVLGSPVLNNAAKKALEAVGAKNIPDQPTTWIKEKMESVGLGKGPEAYLEKEGGVGRDTWEQHFGPNFPSNGYTAQARLNNLARTASQGWDGKEDKAGPTHRPLPVTTHKVGGRKPSAYALFVKEYSKKHPGLGKSLMKEAASAWKKR